MNIKKMVTTIAFLLFVMWVLNNSTSAATTLANKLDSITNFVEVFSENVGK